MERIYFTKKKLNFYFQKIPKINSVKLIHIISRVFLAWTFLNFLAYCVSEGSDFQAFGGGDLKGSMLNDLKK